jgi:predicted metal-dependent phosphoesterase TrpH
MCQPSAEVHVDCSLKDVTRRDVKGHEAMLSRIDLHTHTIASDGVLTSRDLVQMALDRGLKVLAVTDHDTVAGVQPAIEAARGTALCVLPGVELSALHGTESVHLLGYGFDHTSPFLVKKLRSLSLGSEERARAIVEMLAEAGVPIPWERVAKIGKDTITRPHIARVLVEEGRAVDISDAFARYIGEGCPAYLPSSRMSLEEAANLVAQAGGQVGIAHPLGTHPALDFEAVLPAALAAGITGVEVYHTEHTVAATERLKRFATARDLWWSGGSDFHGPSRPAAVVGGVYVPDEVLKQGPFAGALRAWKRCTNPGVTE